MCIGIPVKVERLSGLWAECSSRDGLRKVDLSLTGVVPVGTWLLTFLDAAREIISAARAQEIEAALTALASIARGEFNQDALDACFGDLVNREPQLPAHLQDVKP